MFLLCMHEVGLQHCFVYLFFWFFHFEMLPMLFDSVFFFSIYLEFFAYVLMHFKEIFKFFLSISCLPTLVIIQKNFNQTVSFSNSLFIATMKLIITPSIIHHSKQKVFNLVNDQVLDAACIVKSIMHYILDFQ